MNSDNTYTNRKIIFFDGVCNLCNSSVQRVLKNDPKGKFLFAPLQSDRSRAFLQNIDPELSDADSIVLYDRGKTYVRSAAVLRIASQMAGLYPLLVVFWIIPTWIRNRLYDWIAKNRYHWFGRQQECMVPTESVRSRFIFQ